MSYCYVDIKGLEVRNLACLLFNTWAQNFQESRECSVNVAMNFSLSLVSKTLKIFHPLLSNRYDMYKLIYYLCEFSFSARVVEFLILRKFNVVHMKNSFSFSLKRVVMCESSVA